jgi:hypothetical protein
LDGNMAYGIGWGVAFVEYLKDAGRNFTRASFIKTMEDTTLNETPSLVPLRYTASDHQGLNGGYLVTVTSSSATQALSGKVYVTDSTPNGAVNTASKLSSGIPSWLR